MKPQKNSWVCFGQILCWVAQRFRKCSNTKEMARSIAFYLYCAYVAAIRIANTCSHKCAVTRPPVPLLLETPPCVLSTTLQKFARLPSSTRILGWASALRKCHRLVSRRRKCDISI